MTTEQTIYYTKYWKSYFLQIKHSLNWIKKQIENYDELNDIIIETETKKEKLNFIIFIVKQQTYDYENGKIMLSNNHFSEMIAEITNDLKCMIKDIKTWARTTHNRVENFYPYEDETMINWDEKSAKLSKEMQWCHPKDREKYLCDKFFEKELIKRNEKNQKKTYFFMVKRKCRA